MAIARDTPNKFVAEDGSDVIDEASEREGPSRGRIQGMDRSPPFVGKPARLRSGHKRKYYRNEVSVEKK
ncbi:hypothetical protein ACHAWF_000688 [Thalassiosira exigua]